MFSQKSIRGRFIVQLVVTSVTLVGIFSFILYYYIKNTIYEDLVSSLQAQVTMVAKSISLDHIKNDVPIKIEKNILKENTTIKIISQSDKKNKTLIQNEQKNQKEHIILYHKIESADKFIVITHETSSTKRLLNKILRNIFIANMGAIIAIVFVAMFLSRTMLIPIKVLANKLAKMNEKHLNHVDTKELYEEFLPLGRSLNRLIDRIQTFIKYQTEFFVGIAHELKTPLSVMKTKNEVTLMKDRDVKSYKEAIMQNINSVDEMNQMISAILEIGRQEGAQLDPPVVVDLVTFIKEKANGFKILARADKKDIELDIKPSAFPTLTQPTLVLHILQNFVQNAIKFSPENSIVTIRTKGDDNGFTIEVLDQGCGLNENVDIFAPFKRAGNKGGVGLGLYLAKGAAQALNSHISVKNRKDSQGTIATLFIPRQSPIK